jgi:hypothetical protein
VQKNILDIALDRRTSASLLAKAGADISVIKRHGAWKSSNVAEGYVDDSLENRTTLINDQ